MSNVKTNTIKRFVMDLFKDNNWGTRPYFTHLELVAGKAIELNDSIYDGKLNPEMINNVAFLHDTLEDYPATKNEVKTMITENEFNTIELLTRNESDTYKEYIQNIHESGNELARLIKLADLSVNMNGDPIPNSLRERYEEAYNVLELVA